ncbi:MAG: FMN-binding protein, partial [Clostridia bacterium]|nr:FMN-binding protein [Clostridia bacterium]
MKKILALILALAMMMTAGLALADNSYTGTGKGFAGDIKVTVTLADDGSIVDVTVDECNDTPGVCDTAVEKVPADMKELNSINVDTVSGATFTSQGILAAAKDALESNGVDTTALM